MQLSQQLMNAYATTSWMIFGEYWILWKDIQLESN